LSKQLSDYLYYEEKDPELKIYHADCLEIVPMLSSVDLVVTDPPYGIGASTKAFTRSGKQTGKSLALSGIRYEPSDWDNEKPSKAIFDLLLKSAVYQIIWGGNYFGMPGSSGWLVWDKDNGDNRYADCELAWTNLPQAVRKIRHRWMGMLQENMKEKEERFHPTQKPVPVMRWCLSFAEGTVLDPFLGSGTTLVACKEMNRNGIGIEINEKYCEIAKKRLKATPRPLFKEVIQAPKQLSF